MAASFRTRMASFDWSDYTTIRISPSPTKYSKVTAAVKKEGRTLSFRQSSTTSRKIYVRKTVCINGDVLRGRDVPREYEIWSSLGNHPYVLACEDFQCLANSRGLDEATFWSEYCAKGDLGQFVTKHGSARLSPSQVEQITYQISSALAFIHYGLYITLDSHGDVEELELFDHTTLMHRDIKPQNIFISYMGFYHDPTGDIHVKLGDFGCAKQLDDDTSMSDTGTYYYKAPETRCISPSGQFQRPVATVKSDIWSFGATIRDISDDMPDLCVSCCHDTPAKRPSSVQLLESLRERMRRDYKVSSFVIEALKKDKDSTFWDYPLIERILEAGGDDELRKPGTVSHLQLMTDTPNKSVKDTESVYQLLLKYSTPPSTSLRKPPKNDSSLSKSLSTSLSKSPSTDLSTLPDSSLSEHTSTSLSKSLSTSLSTPPITNTSKPPKNDSLSKYLSTSLSESPNTGRNTHLSTSLSKPSSTHLGPPPNTDLSTPPIIISNEIHGRARRRIQRKRPKPLSLSEFLNS